MNRQLKIASSAKELDQVRAALLGDFELLPDLESVGEIEEQPVGGRQPLGFEPLAYFVVVFAAHLSADAVKSLARLVAKKYSDSKKRVTVELPEE